MNILLALSSLIFIVISFILFIAHFDHSQAVKLNTEVWDYGSFDIFVKEFNRTKWRDINDRNVYKESVFDHRTGSRVHYGIIEFNGKGMILPFLDYYKFRKFMKAYNAKNPVNRGHKKGLWVKDNTDSKVIKMFEDK